MNKNLVFLYVGLISFLIGSLVTSSLYQYDIEELSNASSRFRSSVLNRVEENFTAVTILYHTNYGESEHIITLSIPFEKYNSTHFSNHPIWNNESLESAKDYVTEDEIIINQIVETVKNQTRNEEDLANSLLDFVQDKQNGLSIRYYPTNELKYPIETLVEMGGDCDTHAILYATLMKSAGFKVLLLYSNEQVEGQHHVAIAVHLQTPPINSLTEITDSIFTYNEEKYYYAETTGWGWRVADLPPGFQNITFQIMPL